MAGRIVQTDAKIRLRREIQPLLNFLPRRQQIAQADDREIVNERCAEHGCAAARRSDARNHFNVHIRMLLTHLIHEPRHAVHTGVTGANHGHGLAGQRGIARQLAAVDFLFHRCLQNFLVPDERAHEVNIRRVSRDYIAVFDCLTGARGHLIRAARADSNYIQFHIMLLSRSCGALRKIASRQASSARSSSWFCIPASIH